MTTIRKSSPLKRLTKVYATGEVEVRALRGVDLEVSAW